MKRIDSSTVSADTSSEGKPVDNCVRPRLHSIQIVILHFLLVYNHWWLLRHTVAVPMHTRDQVFGSARA